MSETTPIEHPSRLTSGDFTAADEPLRLLAAWLADATQREPDNPNAMALASVDADGIPDVRMVLLKGLDEHGLVFYTNLDSKKGRQLGLNPKAALLFHWKSSNRQVRLRGAVERVSEAEADACVAGDADVDADVLPHPVRTSTAEAAIRTRLMPVRLMPVCPMPVCLMPTPRRTPRSRRRGPRCPAGSESRRSAGRAASARSPR